MKTKSAKKWDQKAEEYAEMASSEEKDAYEYDINFPSLELMLPDKVKNTLILGSGNGVFANKLSENSENVVATDVSPKMVEICQKNNPDIKCQVLDLERSFSSLENTFDLIFCKLVLMFVDDIENVARESFKVANNTGHLLISVPHPSYWLVNYLEDLYEVKNRPEFKVLESGYFTETEIVKSIGGNKELTFGFKNRTLSTYINSFCKHGWRVDLIDEPQLTDEFIKKNPQYSSKKNIPMRLNIRFSK